MTFDQTVSRIFLGSATLTAGNGGISRVARMSARALMEGGHSLSMASYLDDEPVVIGAATASIAHGSKLRFAALCHQAALRHARFLYDTPGVARARPRFPGLRRPYAVWMCGAEGWEGLTPTSARSFADADLVFTISKFTLERHEACHGHLPNARVCWLGTEQDAPPAAMADLSGPPSVLIVGRITATEGLKGHNELVDCWPKVVAAVPDARLILAGGGTGLDRMREHVRKSSAAANIDVLGFVPEHRLPALYERAHVFAMPSRQEGFGIVYVEAMRYGLPVIASTHDGGQEINVDGETGFNVDLRRKDELTERLIYLLRDRDRAFTLGRAGFERWRQHFRYGCFEKRFLQYWQKFPSSAADAVELRHREGALDASR
jgi:phosphatidylinositol alpha-1,6-mannosyltransferase